MKTLKFTTSKPQAFGQLGDLFVDYTKYDGLEEPYSIKGKTAYIHGNAEELAGYDIPAFIEGNLEQLDAKEQDIVMILSDGEYNCKAELQSNGSYYLTLK
jgi:hypothetical protein